MTTVTTVRSGTSHTGAIVGGVVGGVFIHLQYLGSHADLRFENQGLAFIAVLTLLVLFFLRRERQKRMEKAFDGDFNPDRTSARPASMAYDDKGVRHGATLPNVGVDVSNEEALGDDGMGGRLGGTAIGGGILTPFVLGAPNTHNHNENSQRQHYAPSQYGGTNSTSEYPVSSSTTGSYYPTLPNPHEYPPHLVPGTPSSGPGTAFSSGTRSSKEREARGFGVANPTDGEPSSSAPRVHQDGGRIPEETEIPPTYDSIPRD